ncbi:wiskott-Aldrich syndrome protein homolog 1-like [Triticum urartu]|uniref:wiskott-Aldrich syndrome protein homolog 1-like n=1 Tax=Triticum urartu TaxID=4572 RepID=UPI002043DFA1|nr:wiskott-Aldrich syndrome protein homolog 1-like [Triticum urartu]
MAAECEQGRWKRREQRDAWACPIPPPPPSKSSSGSLPIHPRPLHKIPHRANPAAPFRSKHPSHGELARRQPLTCDRFTRTPAPVASVPCSPDARSRSSPWPSSTCSSRSHRAIHVAPTLPPSRSLLLLSLNSLSVSVPGTLKELVAATLNPVVLCLASAPLERDEVDQIRARDPCSRPSPAIDAVFFRLLRPASIEAAIQARSRSDPPSGRPAPLPDLPCFALVLAGSPRLPGALAVSASPAVAKSLRPCPVSTSPSFEQRTSASSSCAWAASAHQA